MATMYRIVFAIERQTDADEDFVEVGFGSSCSHEDLDAAMYEADTLLTRREWETTSGMPDPSEFERPPLYGDPQ